MTRIIRFDCYEVHLDTGQIYRRGARLRLPEQPFRVLAELLEHPGDLVTRGELRRRLWPGDVFVDFEAALNTAVAKAREALADSAAQPRFIETLPKRGYRFIAPVSEPAQPAQPAPLRRARLLVLPFANPSGDPAQEYFSDAMTDEVITALAGLSPDVLAVIARTTAMHYKHSRKDIAGIARELNLDYIVEGAARRAGDDVSLNVQLIRASDQAHVWARRYDVPLAAVFGAHSAISRAIGEEVGVAASDKLHSDTAVRKPTADLAAYTLYQQGRHHFYRATPGGFAAAKQCYEQAIARDPRFALAYDALAELYFYLGFLGFAPLKEVTATGMFCALRALEIDNTLAETHALFGMYRRDIDSDSEMKRALDRARELRPWSPLVKLRYAISWLMPSGRLEEAITELEGALERDPLAMMVRTWLGVMFWLRREYDRAIEQARLVVEIEPASYIGYWHLGMYAREKGSFEESLSAHRRAVELSDGGMLMLGWLGLALGQSGDRAEARAVLDRLQKAAACTYVPPTSFAWTYLGLGDIDNTFLWMDRAADARDPMLMPIQMYPFLDPVRQDPRYAALLQKLTRSGRPPGPPRRDGTEGTAESRGQGQQAHHRRIERPREQ